MGPPRTRRATAEQRLCAWPRRKDIWRLFRHYSPLEPPRTRRGTTKQRLFSLPRRTDIWRLVRHCSPLEPPRTRRGTTKQRLFSWPRRTDIWRLFRRCSPLEPRRTRRGTTPYNQGQYFLGNSIRFSRMCIVSRKVGNMETLALAPRWKPQNVLLAGIWSIVH